MEIKEFFLHKFFINLAVAHFFGHPICLVGLLNTKCEKYERRYISIECQATGILK